MAKDNSGNWKVVVELVSAGAILLGLIFVGLELRQNTSAVQSATLQEMLGLSTNYLTDTASDPDLLQVLMKAETDLSDLSELESYQVRRLLRGQLLRYQGAYRQWVRGSLDATDWEIYERFLCQSGGREDTVAHFWPVERYRFLQGFVDHVEGESCRPDLKEK